MNNIKISLILPSLNVHEYIEECLDSVVNQSLREIEIICVDAGSTDGTCEIIEQYAAKDDRILLIHSAKKSYGYQMNLAMDAARGEYIGIVETDDFVPHDMYASLYQIAEEHQVDFVKADFYRFTHHADGSLDKTLFRLTNEKKYYHRIIDIEEHPECYDFVMNTWSGIYRRSFLQEHHIRHNETPGASFQDNGFWFQTFMYAHRAYFVDTPYYMNRRDNPNSSVYRADKIYVICDEYAYILKVLEKQPDIFERLKGVYTYVYFKNLRWTLDRIHYRDRPDFYRYVQKTVRGWAERGMIDYRVVARWSEWAAYDLYEILHAPDHFYERVFGITTHIMQGLREEREVYLYGAGLLGQSCYQELKKEGLSDRVKGFIVSSEKDAGGLICGNVPVLTLASMKGHEDAAILLTVKPKYKREVKEALLKAHFTRMTPWPDISYIRAAEMTLHTSLWEKDLMNGQVFPYDLVPRGSRIGLYGSGRLGQCYYRQIQATGYATVVEWADPDAGRFQAQQKEVLLKSTFDHVADMDKVVIAFRDKGQAKAAYWAVLSAGVPIEKIVWNGSRMEKTWSDEIKENALEPAIAVARKQIAALECEVHRKRKATQKLLKEIEKGRKVLPEAVLAVDSGTCVEAITRLLSGFDRGMELLLQGEEVLQLEQLPELLSVALGSGEEADGTSVFVHVTLETRSKLPPISSVRNVLRDARILVRFLAEGYDGEMEQLAEGLRKDGIRAVVKFADPVIERG